ncbi:MAG TPA: TRAP transporter large permease, partial [Thermodesulfobacteriota bacterium]|nr:TRAP transporter large permease [Thermodesulfobacteriota bacterium]
MLSLSLLGIVFVLLMLLGIPITFSLGLSSVAGLWIMEKPLATVPIAIFQGIESWVLLAIPSFIFAGILMERCRISYQLIDLARSMVGWIRGGLGMTTVVGEILFSGVSGSTVADVSAIGSMMAPPMIQGGYKAEHTASIIAASTCFGILIPPAIFMIVVGTQTSTSIVGIFLGAILPGLVAGGLLMLTIYFQAMRFKWPVDAKPNFKWLLRATKNALIALFVPIFIIGGFRFGVFTATEAGAVCALYAVVVSLLLYRNVTIKEILDILMETALLTAAVIFLLGTATIYQYIMASLGVPQLFLQISQNLSPHVFLFVISFITLLFGLVMEGLPAAVILLPVVFPVAVAKGINGIHFCVILTLASCIGFFLPPTGAGLLLCLRFTKVKLSWPFIRAYTPYVITIVISLIIIILFPSL